jgi:hypothetical protein
LNSVCFKNAGTGKPPNGRIRAHLSVPDKIKHSLIMAAILYVAAFFCGGNLYVRTGLRFVKKYDTMTKN